MKAFFAAGTVALAGLAFAAQAATTSASSIPQPGFKAGDSWVFDVADQKGNSGYSRAQVDEIIERVNADAMVLGVKIDGAPTNFNDSIIGLDWSGRAIVDGKQIVAARPLSFPLAVGSTWSSDYDAPPARNQKSGHFHMTYKAVGWEDVTVPAGTFHALKVEAHGTSETVEEIPAVAISAATSSSSGVNGLTHVEKGQTRTVDVTIYGEYYYVPDVKHTVKRVFERYNENSILVSRNTESLVSFKLAQ